MFAPSERANMTISSARNALAIARGRRARLGRVRESLVRSLVASFAAEYRAGKAIRSARSRRLRIAWRTRGITHENVRRDSAVVRGACDIVHDDSTQ